MVLHSWVCRIIIAPGSRDMTGQNTAEEQMFASAAQLMHVGRMSSTDMQFAVALIPLPN